MAMKNLISREDLDAGRIDFSELDSGDRLPPTHPGDVLKYEFLEPLGLSANALALALRVPANRITTIIAGQRAISAETALRLARHFGTSAAFWLQLQAAYELEIAERSTGDRVRKEVSPREAA
jgi:antitoxin HigA-1